MTGGLGLAVAFVAGVASFASPCVLPLIPAYLGMLTGLNLASMGKRRLEVVTHALLFVAGFSLLFVLTGAAATALGRSLSLYLPWFQRLGGAFLVLLGLHMLRVLPLPFLYGEQTLRGLKPGAGYLASFVTGLVFFAGWVPCVGPVLAAIFMLASTTATVYRGMALLAAYSLGLGLPFLAIALFAGYLLPYLRRLGRLARWVEVASGLLVIIIGVAVFFDSLAMFARYGSLFGL